ncbi:MAG: DUF2062 domain-containing protein [Pseudomonadota bacterium]
MLFDRRQEPRAMEKVRVALWPRRSFSRSFQYVKHRILRLQGSPHAIAAGVAAGAFASCTPLVGFHFLLAFAVAYVIGGSLIAAALGTAVGNPLTFPLIWVSSFQVGELILGAPKGGAGGTPLDLSFDLIWSSFWTVWPTLQVMILGGAVIGLVLGTILYFLVRSAVMMSKSMRAERLAKRARDKAP